MRAPRTRTVKDISERWLLTYADLMNLLLILFIILFSMSQIDAEKFTRLASSLRQALGDSTAATHIGTTGTSNSLVDLESQSASTVIPEKLEDQRMEAIKNEVDKIIKENNLGEQVTVSVQERGVEISMKDSLLFGSGSAIIEPQAKKALAEIGTVLKTLPGNQINIEGHTDNVPINSYQFSSNWELSAARAVNVLQFLVNTAKLDPNSISFTGYGEYRPKVPNSNDKNRAQNRRVDIVIIKNA